MNSSLFRLAMDFWAIYLCAGIRTVLSSVLPSAYGLAVGAAVTGNGGGAVGWLLTALGLEGAMAALKIFEDRVQTRYWARAQIRQCKKGKGGADAITEAGWLTNRLDLVAWKLPTVVENLGTLIVAPVVIMGQYGYSALTLLAAWALPAVAMALTRRLYMSVYTESARNGIQFHRCLSAKHGLASVMRRRVYLWYLRHRTEEAMKSAMTWWAMAVSVVAAAINPAAAAAFMVAAGRIAGGLKDVFEVWIEYVRVRGQEIAQHEARKDKDPGDPLATVTTIVAPVAPQGTVSMVEAVPADVWNVVVTDTTTD